MSSATLIDVTASTSGATTPRSKIDDLSRDDLIRFVKKQIDKLKTAKCENDKLKMELVEVQMNFTEFEEKLFEEHKKSTEKTEEILRLNEICNNLKMDCSELTLELGKLKTNLQESHDFSEKSESRELRSELNGTDGIHIQMVQLQNEMASVKDCLRKQTEECCKQTEENEKLTYTVAELRSLLDDAYTQLESYKEKKSVQNVITLEMADFEKTVERLQKELKAVNLEKQLLQSELDASKKEMDNIREGKNFLNNSIAELNTSFLNLKEELEERKKELEIHEKDRKDLTDELQKQVSARDKERDQLMTVIGESEKKIGDLEALNASLNRQLISVRSQRESLQRQLDDLSEEHSTFKTRALYVLEQKKSDSDERVKGEIEILEETIRQQNKAIDNLTNSQRMLQGELDSSSGHVKTLSAEISNLQLQLTTATESHKKELSEQRREFELRFAAEVNVNSELLAQIDTITISHNRERENLLLTTRQERNSLKEEISRLRRTLDEEVLRRKEMEKIQSAAAQNVDIQFQKSFKENLPTSIHLTRPSIEIADVAGKDAKTDDNEGKCDESLEEVIYGEPEDLIVTDIWNQPDSSLTRQDATKIFSRQLEQTRELLNESETTNARLIEQAKLLKEVIRRMELDRERETHVANTEYLKNVVMKFIAPKKVANERGCLIPVLTTMLKLNDDEVNLLNKVAEVDAAVTKVAPSSWTSYIWSGSS